MAKSLDDTTVVTETPARPAVLRLGRAAIGDLVWAGTSYIVVNYTNDGDGPHYWVTYAPFGVPADPKDKGIPVRPHEYYGYRRRELAGRKS